ncbi:MAG: DUF4230 domain-containing protein [Anaerolineae bacterium]|nr:DUF4230 domain-containing protein [Anaerolineae bacterium]
MRRIGNFLTIIGVIVVIVVVAWLVLRLQGTGSKSGENSGSLIPQPTPTIYPSAMTVIEGIQSLSRLETASYHIEKVITAESGQGPLGFLFGDKLLLIAYGQVIAGVDLSLLGPESLSTLPDGTVYIRLPQTEVFVAALDNNRTYVYDRRTGMAGLNVQLETAARQEAERLILQAALEEGLLEKADENARSVLRSFVLSLGFEHVIFVEVLPTPAPSPTPTAVIKLNVAP